MFASILPILSMWIYCPVYFNLLWRLSVAVPRSSSSHAHMLGWIDETKLHVVREQWGDGRQVGRPRADRAIVHLMRILAPFGAPSISLLGPVPEHTRVRVRGEVCATHRPLSPLKHAVVALLHFLPPRHR